MTVVSAIDTSTAEGKVLDCVSSERLEKHVNEIAKWDRAAGSEGEAKSFDYIEAELRALGLEVNRYSGTALVSIPGPASLAVTAPEAIDIGCITHAMCISTPPEGLSLEVVYGGKGSSADLANLEIAGKILMVDGLVSPNVVHRAEQRGCFAQIFISDDHLRQGIISRLYGSPTDETLHLLPRSTSVSITQSDGERIKKLLAGGTVRVTIHAQIDTGWRQLPLVTADLQPEGSDGTFAFFGVHVDAWDRGATDNGAGNAALLEIARVMNEHKEGMKRGARFLFWSGHSHGRYAGSAWYVDNFWQDLYDHAVLGMSIDSPGNKGGTGLGMAKVMDEVSRLATDVAQSVLGETPPPANRPRGGEQPLWRVGIPSMNPIRSRQAKDSPHAMVFEPGSAWWHHAVEDLPDKVDYAVLRRDTQIYLLGMWRVCAADVLPFDYSYLAGKLQEHLRGYGVDFDLSPALEAAAELEEATKPLPSLAPERANPALMAIGRALIPVLYTEAGQFDTELVGLKGYVPGLEPLRRLAELDPDSWEAHGLRTAMVRERNRLVFALKQATKLAREALA